MAPRKKSSAHKIDICRRTVGSIFSKLLKVKFSAVPSIFSTNIERILSFKVIENVSMLSKRVVGPLREAVHATCAPSLARQLHTRTLQIPRARLMEVDEYIM
jgi:hypothetical protein